MDSMREEVLEKVYISYFLEFFIRGKRTGEIFKIWKRIFKGYPAASRVLQKVHPSELHPGISACFSKQPTQLWIPSLQFLINWLSLEKRKNICSHASDASIFLLMFLDRGLHALQKIFFPQLGVPRQEPANKRERLLPMLDGGDWSTTATRWIWLYVVLR